MDHARFVFPLNSLHTTSSYLLNGNVAHGIACCPKCSKHQTVYTLASCQIRKIAGCTCPGNARNVFPPSQVSDPNVHHVACVTHVPWCMPGSFSGFLWSRWREKRSRHSRRLRNPQVYVSGKRPMLCGVVAVTIVVTHNAHCSPGLLCRRQMAVIVIIDEPGWQ